MKRGTDSLSRTRKRAKTSRTPLPNQTSPTTALSVGSDAAVRELARPYLLATAKVPLDALDSHWTLGHNRSIDQKQVRNLRDIFSTQGLDREYKDHCIRGLCTQADVRQIKEHLGQAGYAIEHRKWPSFDDWQAVTGTKIELIAGQHRVEALRDHVRCSKLDEDQLWWICELYDKERLPPELNIRLRANRSDATLPDSHGQIWNEFATLASTDPEIFQGSNATIEKEMLQRLRLGNGAKFPIRRLVTLWRNIKWHAMITAWCSTTLGQATFNISTWDEMARCRIDDFWFNILKRILKIISEMCSRSPLCVTANDWTYLARLSQTGNTCSVSDLFYPPTVRRSSLHGQGRANDADETPPWPRAKRFLTALTDDEYRHAYRYIIGIEQRDLVDIQARFKVVKREGKVIANVMLHVVWWLNQNPTIAKDRDNNKPPLRLDFLPALALRHKHHSDQISVELEKEIVLFVQREYDNLTGYGLKPYLNQYPLEHPTSYPQRFHHTAWRNLLRLVQRFAGHELPYVAISHFSDEESCSVRSESPSTITRKICSMLPQITEISTNPALNHAGALKALGTALQPIIAAWVVRQFEMSLQPESEVETNDGPASPTEMIRSTQERVDLLLEAPRRSPELDSESTISSPSPSPGASQTRLREEAAAIHPVKAVHHDPSRFEHGVQRRVSLPAQGEDVVLSSQKNHALPPRGFIPKSTQSWRNGHFARSSSK